MKFRHNHVFLVTQEIPLEKCDCVYAPSGDNNGGHKVTLLKCSCGKNTWESKHYWKFVPVTRFTQFGKIRDLGD